MKLLYFFLGIMVVYSLVQSVRFRIARLAHRTDRPDLSRVVMEEDPKVGAEEAWLTAKGRDLHFKHRMYDALGLLAAFVMLMLWLSDSGILERILSMS